jgi:hypothetical protein
MKQHLTAGRLACLGVIIWVVGNELTEPVMRQTLEILAALLAIAGLVFETVI